MWLSATAGDVQPFLEVSPVIAPRGCDLLDPITRLVADGCATSRGASVHLTEGGEGDGGEPR